MKNQELTIVFDRERASNYDRQEGYLDSLTASDDYES